MHHPLLHLPKHEKCDLEVLMSCMHQTDFSIAEKSKINSDLLIVNQCEHDGYDERSVDGFLWRMISTTERGLSKSRNTALKNARGKICVFADDDEVFADHYRQIICDAFEKIPDAAVIAFNVARINNDLKKKYYTITQIKEASPKRSFGSPMLSVRTDALIHHNIFFNEQFGSGSEWGGGEDTLIQNEIRAEGLKIYEIPDELATIDYSQGSHWFFGFDERYFYNIGAFCRFRHNRPLRRYAYYLYLVFIKLRHDRRLSVPQRLKWLILGERGWQRQVPYRQYIAGDKQ